MKIVQGYMLRNIADSWVVIPVGKLSGDRSHMLSLSGSSALLWQLLEKGADREELISAVIEAYSVDRAIVEADVDDFLAKLENENLLTD